MSKTTLDKFSSGWWFFCKEDLAESDFLPFLSITSDSEIDKQQSHSQFCSQDIPKNPSSQLNVSCIIHFSDISWVSSALPFHSHREGRLWCSLPYFSLSQKKIHSALGHWWLCFLALEPTPYSQVQKVSSRTHYPLSHKHSFIIIYAWVFCEKPWWSFHLQPVHSPHFVVVCGGSGSHIWVLVLPNVRNYSQLILTQH